MASLLRQIVAGPRARHPEAGLDLCYVTDNLIATSGPGASYPQVAYRNPLKDLVKFLDSKHGVEWAIWEFRAEGTGYADEDVYNRINHYPWPDHHPPPFKLIPLIMASMRNWLKEKPTTKDERVAIVHCKAGKGRSGTVACSYLMSEEGWELEDARKRFTERRMRPGFGHGVSIPSQVRWLTYTDRWRKHGKLYVDNPVEVLELHVWGLRDGVKIAIEGFVEDGKVIKNFHMFERSEREIVRGAIVKSSGFSNVALEAMGKGKKKSTIMQPSPTPHSQENLESPTPSNKSKDRLDRIQSELLAGGDGGDVIFRPSSRVVLPTSDLNIDFERRNKSKYGGFTMVTSVAHVWINTFFEGRGPEQDGKANDSGVFEIEWDAMDGIKGSSRKGTRAFDKMAVLWKHVSAVTDDDNVDINPNVVVQPSESEVVPQTGAATGQDDKSQDFEKKLGLRADTTESAAISRASSMISNNGASKEKDISEIEGVQSYHPESESNTIQPSDSPNSITKDGLDAINDGVKTLSTEQLPDDKPNPALSNVHSPTTGSVQQNNDGSPTVS